MRAGNTRISVSVSDPSTKVIFTNFIDITIYEELRLISHDLLLNSLLVTPNTEFILITNKNKVRIVLLLVFVVYLLLLFSSIRYLNNHSK